MVTLEAARAFAQIDDAEARLMAGPECPIVVVGRSSDAGPSSPCPDVAPGNRTLGVMLPYTPLHHLLLEGLPPLVMTSGNRSDTPMVTDNAEALREMSGIADAFLFHNRDIHIW